MHVVIVGSGVAGVSFAEKFRALCASADISLISFENEGYYSRPLLSRGFTKNDIEQTIVLKTFEQLRANRINVHSYTKVTAINRAEQTLVLRETDQNHSLSYDILVLALGSAAFIPPPYQPFTPLFSCLNSLANLKALRQFRQAIQLQQRKPRWAIIGGGLIGCEVASDLAVAGDQVTLFHVMDRLMERQLVPEDSATLQTVLQGSGVEVLLNQQINALAQAGEQVSITTEVTAQFDHVIVACGFKPRTELAAQAGLTVARGIKVNAYLQTDDPRIYALGDVAQLPDGHLYAFILPIRNQANWLASYLAGQEQQAWAAPTFTTKAKVHGFEAAYPYQL